MATTLAPPLPHPPPSLVAAPIARRAGGALIDLGLIIAGEVGVAIVGAVLVQIPLATGWDLTAVRICVAIARAITQLAIYLGPVIYLYVSWRRGASVGMRAMHCRLCTSDAFRPPSSSQVVLRVCGLWFSVVCAGIGLLWGLVRGDRRGWPDLYAGTVVVHIPPPPVWFVPSYGGWHAGAVPAPPPMPPSLGPVSAWHPAPASAETAERVPWTWIDVAPVVALILPLSWGVTYVTVLALKWLLHGVALATRRPFEALASDATAYGAVFLLVLLFVKVRRHAGVAALGLHRAPWRWLLAALPFTFAALVLEGITGRLSQSLFPEAPQNQCVDIRSAYEGALWLAIIGVAVIAPLVEEIVFRGMVFGWLRGRTPVAWAIVISAALFSLEHIGFLQLTLFLPIFTAGVVLAILYHHARSIWPSFLVHGGFNLIGVLVLFTTPAC
jgi:membrane protease YdiL (CAAX protease family)/uncharacterized RDD family membrane protein YckC